MEETNRLSARSETFIDNLRLYLMTSGKNESEIKELIEELRVHFIETQKNGRSIDEIIDGTPEQYMVSLKREMKTDYKSLIKNLPFYFTGVIAYLIMGPAIRGEFELNMVQVVGFPIIAVIGLLIYVFFLQQSGKKQFSNKKFFLVGIIASSSVTALFIILLVGSGLIVEPFYKGSTTVNWIIVAICTCIFVSCAIWSKVWFPIWIPVILFIPDFLFRFSNLTDETILIIGFASFILLFVLILLSLVVTERYRVKD